MTSITIRDSRDDDVATIATIYAHHVRYGLASFEETPPGTAEVARRRNDVLARGWPHLVAVEAAGTSGERVVGYSYCGPYRPRAAYRFTVEDSIYVDPERQRRGIGGLLLPVLIDRATVAGARQMVAVIGDSANAPSIGLHARHGFRMVGIVEAVGWKFGRWVDGVIMQRTLGEGSATPPR
jgi:phosphinothricin acetyltransferase